MIQMTEAIDLVERLRAELESLREKAEERPSPIGHHGEVIRKTRKRQGLTQAELAALAGIGTATLKRLEAGGKDVTFANLVKVLDALGIGLWIG